MLRKKVVKEQDSSDKLKGFDDFQVKLGDLMRGERATLGKSLMDVQRELRIKASYISAIENCDASAFETQGFIPGYVKSYARYLKLDPEEVFKSFCDESGFVLPTSFSSKSEYDGETPIIASSVALKSDEMFNRPNVGSAASAGTFWERVEPGAVGSLAALIAVVGLIGYGGWSLIQEIQRVQVAPADNAPIVLSDLEVSPATTDAAGSQFDMVSPAQAFPDVNLMDRLYRPQPLDVPVLIARDAPISTLDPRRVGAFATPEPSRSAIDSLIAEIATPTSPDQESIAPQVVENTPPQLAVFASRTAWVQIKSAAGNVIFSKEMQAGEEFILPATEVPPTLRAGMSGSVYFAVNGTLYGPAGTGTAVAKNIALSVDDLTQNFQVADLTSDPQIERAYAQADVTSFSLSFDESN